MQSQFHTLTVCGLDSLPQARLIRQEVFVEEQGFHNEFDDIDSRALHVLVLEGENPAATGRTFCDKGGKVWHMGRISVRKPYSGKQLGRMVMTELEKAAVAHGAEKLVLSAQVQAVCFYQKLGYTVCSGEYLDEHCPHVDMEKSI